MGGKGRPKPHCDMRPVQLGPSDTGTGTGRNIWQSPCIMTTSSDPAWKKLVAFPGHVYIVGCGALGQGVIPYVVRLWAG